MAPGFEGESHVALLNELTYISHHRGIEDVVSMWRESRNTSVAVLYFFKPRQYC